MKDFFKYLTISEEDINWGLYLNVAGTAKILPETQYPPTEHPSGYFFKWESGRILNEYQLVYITEGAGVFENNYGKTTLKPGSLIIIRPDEWHRYRPISKTGWIENYIGFNGLIAKKIFTNSVLSSFLSVVQCGIKEEIIDLYLKIFDLVEKEIPGFQQITSGMIVELLGYIRSFEKQKGFSGNPVVKIIEEVRFLMRQNSENQINFENIAKQYNISYSCFRKMFKKYTGVSPGQYHLQLKLIRAKELLVSTNKNIKEISIELGFQTIHYFSLFFKKKTGLTPTEFRSLNNRSVL
jgi:AraC-like DNA-binding protein